MLRFAANLTTLFTEVPFAERFASAAHHGFAGAEFLFPYAFEVDEVAAWLHRAGLASVLFNLPPGDFAAGERGIAALPGREDEFRQSVETALGYARRLGTPRLHAMAGLSSAGACRDVYLRNLRFAADALASEGLTLVIEPINTRDMPGYFLSRQDEALAIIVDVGAPNLRLQCDLYHLQIMSGDVSRTLERDFALIDHIQIAGVPDRHEPDRGELDYRHVLSLLERLGYDGWIGCEYHPHGRTEDGLGWRPG